MLAPVTSLFDQSALIERAERLVAAARAAGADAADAVAVRSLSLSVEVRDGAVEESQSAEGTDRGLRVLIGKRQAGVSFDELNGDPAALAARGVSMAKAAPKNEYACLADERLLARYSPDLDPTGRDLPTVARLEG